MKRWDLQKKSGFLLIEQIFALGIFAISFLLIMGIYKVLLQVQKNMEVPNYVEWHLFVTQIDTHLQGYVKSNAPWDVHFEDGRPIKKDNYIVKAALDHNGIKSSVWISQNGGYHPLLIGYEKFFIISKENGVLLKGILQNHEAFETYFIPGNRVISLEKEIVQKDEMAKEE